MSVPLAEQILGVVKEGLALWKTFISTRQEAYNRQQDKKQIKAIEAAEKGFFVMDGIVNKIENLNMQDGPAFKSDLKSLARYRKHFFHYH